MGKFGNGLDEGGNAEGPKPRGPWLERYGDCLILGPPLHAAEIRSREQLNPVSRVSKNHKIDQGPGNSLRRIHSHLAVDANGDGEE